MDLEPSALSRNGDTAAASEARNEGRDEQRTLLTTSVGTTVTTRTLAISTLAALLSMFFVASPWPLDAKLRAIGRACCAQIPTHTLRVGTQYLPIDSRNTGIYLGVLTVLTILWVSGRGLAGLYSPPAVRNLLLGLTAAMILDGLNSMQHTQHLHGLYPDSNALRVITGTFSGMALTILVIPLFNRIVFQHPEVIAIADDFTDLSGYLGGALMVIVVLLQAPALLFWPLAFASICGLLVTLSMVNTAIVLVSLRRERSINSLRSLVLPALGGLVLTCAEITALDLWRIAAHR